MNDDYECAHCGNTRDRDLLVEIPPGWYLVVHNTLGPYPQGDVLLCSARCIVDSHLELLGTPPEQVAELEKEQG